MAGRMFDGLIAMVLGAACIPGYAAAASEAAGRDTAKSALAGTAWQLVKIMSMDDSVAEPADGSLYTLTFQANGSAKIQADCNRGKGAWTSASSGQLEFGQIASSRALCPPGSLSGKFLAQFPWVRSYVMKNAHLFLATMADGAIIEFAPGPGMPPPVATVLGEPVRATDATEMQAAILTRLFDAYAQAQRIAATPREVDDFVANMQRGMQAAGLSTADDLTPEEAAEAGAIRRQMGQAIIRQWKINRSLHQRYGGRIIYQQLGPEPLDAYREFLEGEQRDGAFTISNEAFADAFWRYFTDESIHDFMAPDGDDAARAFAVPPWQREK